jgi:hypothetical protein
VKKDSAPCSWVVRACQLVKKDSAPCSWVVTTVPRPCPHRLMCTTWSLPWRPLSPRQLQHQLLSTVIRCRNVKVSNCISVFAIRYCFRSKAAAAWSWPFTTKWRWCYEWVELYLFCPLYAFVVYAGTTLRVPLPVLTLSDVSLCLFPACVSPFILFSLPIFLTFLHVFFLYFLLSCTPLIYYFFLELSLCAALYYAKRGKGFSLYWFRRGEVSAL